MNVRKFSASNSREACRLVREALGPDAVILSNRTINGMVEILALASEDMSSLSEPVVENPVVSQVALAALAAKRQAESEQAANLADALHTVRSAMPDNNQPVTKEISKVMSEIRAMRSMLEAQLAEIAWGSQQKR